MQKVFYILVRVQSGLWRGTCPVAEKQEELIARAAGGDREALSTLLAGCAAGLRVHLAGRIGRRWRSVLDIDDVLQVTYIEAFLRMGRFKPGENGAFCAWIRRIAENNLRDAIKELGRARRSPGAAPAQPASGDDSWASLSCVLTGASTPSQHIMREELVDALRVAMEKLPADYRRVVQLCDLEGRPLGEVAAKLGRSEGAIYMLRARAYDRLKELLGSKS